MHQTGGLPSPQAPETPLTIVIPAAGIGSRFLPVSRTVPKELLPLGDKPLIHHALEEAERAGFANAVIVLSANKDSIRSYFEPEPRLERILEGRGDEHALRRLREASAIAGRLSLQFVDQPWPSGLGDAVLRGRGAAGDAFGVLLPDDVVQGAGHWSQLRHLHAETAGTCLSVRRVPIRQAHRFGIAVCEPAGPWLRVRAVVEKPRPGTARSDLAIFGRYIVDGALLDALEAMRRCEGEELQLTDAIATLIQRGRVFAIRFEGSFFDNGTPEEYAQSQARYSVDVATAASRMASGQFQ
ncbi:MAG: sugar phosphate nucleotidyltransferase [Candidatus Dormibacteraeota bacterium]|nr:sugar phosphate nucleotidyltransferase [Candidatus Dormibacteraeota bacterium]